MLSLLHIRLLGGESDKEEEDKIKRAPIPY